MKKALVTAVTMTYLDKLAAPALAKDKPIYYIDAGPTPLTESLSITAMGCCSGSSACYVYGNPVCGCENACCYQPAHSSTRCATRNNNYCWTCNSGSYVCCDYYCHGNPCHCGSQCSFNQCGTSKC